MLKAVVFVACLPWLAQPSGSDKGDCRNPRYIPMAAGAGCATMDMAYAARRSEASTARASDQASKVWLTSSSVWAMER